MVIFQPIALHVETSWMWPLPWCHWDLRGNTRRKDKANTASPTRSSELFWRIQGSVPELQDRELQYTCVTDMVILPLLRALSLSALDTVGLVVF